MFILRVTSVIEKQKSVNTFQNIAPDGTRTVFYISLNFPSTRRGHYFLMAPQSGIITRDT
ncbi:MAG: hypothetical protein A3J83_04460 [Elusimicrobia bacterium RIFOXYA2_FULL_40_6]|nr:MAG: hypothetical protein A3J83_04460 [Elusimicrobia bacterium RIFOXYA2_FULL_40_6]